MKVCYFGIYDQNYSRNRILIRGLTQNGIEIIECNSRRRGIVKYFDLARKHWRIRKEYDVMVVGFPGYQAMILARFLTRKPIVFDCFTSLYDSMVWDRKSAQPHSLAARYYWLLDWLSMSLADIVLFDTTTHIEYACKEFGVSIEKFRRILVGASTDVFFPETVSRDKKEFLAFFFGTFIPLQGVQYIVEAAKMLSNESVHFLIIGNGQEKKRILAYADELRVKNVTFIDSVPQEKIREDARRADVCLGIFGDTAKTQKVIPNKVYECVAMKKPVITADTPAIRELFTEDDLMLVPAADSRALAESIMRLKNDKENMEKKAQSGYDRFVVNATPLFLGMKLKEILDSTIV